MEKYISILKKYWGFDTFRAIQGDIIASIGAGKDTLGLMPTGGGKSLTFQVPTMAVKGLCIVVTPLIALMRDQVEHLRQKGIKAAMIYSGMSREKIIYTFDNCTFGDYKFLYISPERIGTELFCKRIVQLDVCLIAVDESHCISQWGYDFRPAYLKIADLRKLLPNIPILALTATATSKVVDDIQEKLQFKKKNVFRKSFERKNLAYVVRESEQKQEQLLKILHAIPGSSVVYVRSRKKTQEVADFLVQNNISADFFHAGLSDESKNIKQKQWKQGNCRVMVATNAFGMGIDKPDVRTVVHIDLPDSIEAYFQEAGRAGRDGLKAFAVLLFNNADCTKLKKRIADNFPPKDRIIDVYESLCYFLEIASGTALNNVFAFNLQEFCHTFHLAINPTFNALKILELSGYIELTEELDNPSKLKITLDKEELYLLKGQDNLTEAILQCLLRSYTGLFTDFVHISEDMIAQRLNTTRQKVYEKLILLSKTGVLKYIPFKKTPFIIFKQERQERKRIKITTQAYEERRERYEKQILAMLEYAQRQDICRSRLLLNYFGERNDHNCELCDVCLAKKQNTNTKFIEKIAKEIKHTLLQQACSTKELVKLLHFKETDIIAVCRQLLAEGLIEQQADLRFYYKQK